MKYKSMDVIEITGPVSVELCCWIYDDVRRGSCNRVKAGKLLKMSLKYNTKNKKDQKKCLYYPDEQKIKFYNKHHLEKILYFKTQIAC